MNLPVNQIICGDCLEVMKDWPDNCVDLVFADPPFNVNKEYEKNRNDYPEWCISWIKECFRILKNTGTIYIMTIPRHLDFIMPTMKKYGVFINLISWKHQAGLCDGRRFWGLYQPIVSYGKTVAYKFNKYAETIDNSKRRWGKYKTEYKGQMGDLWMDIPFVFSGAINHPEAIKKPQSNKKLHPCQMPLKLAERAILFSTDDDDIVLEPFGGLATACCSAKARNRRYIGIDISEEYCQIARQRLEAVDTGVPVKEQKQGQRPLFPLEKQ